MEKITYTRDFLLHCARSPLSREKPADWDTFRCIHGNLFLPEVRFGHQDISLCADTNMVNSRYEPEENINKKNKTGRDSDGATEQPGDGATSAVKGGLCEGGGNLVRAHTEVLRPAGFSAWRGGSEIRPKEGDGESSLSVDQVIREVELLCRMSNILSKQ